MPVPALLETLGSLGNEQLPHCDSRSLFQDRFADPLASDDTSPTRKQWFNSLISSSRKACRPTTADWIPPRAIRLYARLASRLLVGLSGGVMENAHVCLDRYGLPLIPGSAIKGCARRMALQALHDWIAAGTPRPEPDDIAAPCCEGFTSPVEMLAGIANVFGWTEKGWVSGETNEGFQCDFAWACGENHEDIWRDAVHIMAAQRGWKLASEKPWKHLPNFAGSVAFLPASPNTDPGLELDVLTPHHSDYYRGERAVATDTEQPVPVYFPAVKPQGEHDYFVFALIPLRLANDADLSRARLWLARGLTTFGLGAKTSAGYGWFDSSEAFHRTIVERRDLLARRAKEEAERKAREEAEARELERKRQQKEEERRALEGLSPDEQEDWKIQQLSDAQFDAKVRNFLKRRGAPTEAEKAAIVRALRGPRIEYWKAFKQKSTKGELAAVAQAIHQLNKQLFADKMP